MGVIVLAGGRGPNHCLKTKAKPDHSNQVKQLLELQAVVFRLKQGTEEAGFLAAFCPIPSTPQLLVIK